MVSKRENANDYFTGKKKAKKGKTQAKHEEKKEEKVPLQHQIETLKFFEEIKVSPPLYTDGIQETLKLINEKKAQYERQQEEALK